jgi:hypothetical protein
MYRGWLIFDPKKTIIVLGIGIYSISFLLHVVVIGSLFPISTWPDSSIKKAGAPRVAVAPADMSPLPVSYAR